MWIGLAVLAFVVAAPIVYFATLSALVQGTRTLGILADGKLLPCPDKPNCVSTFASDGVHDIEPIAIAGDPDEAWQKLRDVIQAQPRTNVVADDGNYMHVEFRSQIFRFPDDVEFVLDRDGKKIDFRSASRAGYSDLGVNRARMEQIRTLVSKSVAPTPATQ